MNLEIGQVFKDKQGNTYTLLSRDKEFGIFKFNAVQKKLKIIQTVCILRIIDENPKGND